MQTRQRWFGRNWETLYQSLTVSHDQLHNTAFCSHVIIFPDHVIVPQLYYVPESELSDEVGTSTGSVTTLRYKLEVRREPTPFVWAQSLFYSAKLLREFLVRQRN